jgi:carboxypeptidase C (cathepsin A)
MTENETDTTPKPDHEPPASSQTNATWTDPDGNALGYTATAGWEVLRKNEKPAAEVFSVSYVADSDEDRPVTFVFNGGPGSSSAWLHVGTVGPRIVAFPADGSLPPMPARLVDNPASWLGFSDLVFIDPVGTGFSRIIETDKEGDDKPKDAPDPKEYYGIKRDLESMGEFMSRWLSNNGRWGSPIFIAGESYGGYRVAKMVRMLQEGTGIGLSGAILISPALEFATLNSTDYDVLPWVDRLPTMAAAAVHHGRSRAYGPDAALADVRAAAADFATGDYVKFLTKGASLPADEQTAILTRLADLVGLDQAVVERSEGRISILTFVRELLRDERKVLGMYDTTVSATDPYPDRDPFAGPDPTLAGIGAAYTAAINRLLRSELGVETSREYTLLSYEVNNDWKVDMQRHALQGAEGATDDFRYGMALNPHLKAYITHGHHDLITPYYASDRLRNLMRLDPSMADRLTVHHFEGGHMFYSKEASRNEFRDAIAEFVAAALPQG